MSKLYANGWKNFVARDKDSIKELRTQIHALASETGLASRLHERGGRMQMVYAWYPEARRVELRYVVTEPHQHAFEIWVCEPQSGVPSLASVWPLMG